MLSIDRFEGEYAVCINEKDEIIRILCNDIDANATEGSILIKKDNKYCIDQDETKKRRDKIKALQESLWE